MHFCRLLKLELDSVERNFLMSFSLPRDASINIFNALRRGAFNEEKHFFELRISPFHPFPNSGVLWEALTSDAYTCLKALFDWCVHA